MKLKLFKAILLACTLFSLHSIKSMEQDLLQAKNQPVTANTRGETGQVVEEYTLQYTIFKEYALKRDFNGIKLCIENGVNVNTPIKFGEDLYPVLHIFAHAHNHEAVKFLLDNGANPASKIVIASKTKTKNLYTSLSESMLSSRSVKDQDAYKKTIELLKQRFAQVCYLLEDSKDNIALESVALQKIKAWSTQLTLKQKSGILDCYFHRCPELVTALCLTGAERSALLKLHKNNETLSKRLEVALAETLAELLAVKKDSANFTEINAYNKYFQNSKDHFNESEREILWVLAAAYGDKKIAQYCFNNKAAADLSRGTIKTILFDLRSKDLLNSSIAKDLKELLDDQSNDITALCCADKLQHYDFIKVLCAQEGIITAENKNILLKQIKNQQTKQIINAVKVAEKATINIDTIIKEERAQAEQLQDAGYSFSKKLFIGAGIVTAVAIGYYFTQNYYYNFAVEQPSISTESTDMHQ